MKKSRKKLLLEELKKNPNITVACLKVGIARQTAYDWKDSDDDFRIEYEKCFELGNDHVYDLAHSQLVKCIEKGQAWAIKHILDKHEKRKNKLLDQGEKITGNTVQFVDFSDPSKEQEIEGLDFPKKKGFGDDIT